MHQTSPTLFVYIGKRQTHHSQLKYEIDVKIHVAVPTENRPLTTNVCVLICLYIFWCWETDDEGGEKDKEKTHHAYSTAHWTCRHIIRARVLSSGTFDVYKMQASKQYWPGILIHNIMRSHIKWMCCLYFVCMYSSEALRLFDRSLAHSFKTKKESKYECECVFVIQTSILVIPSISNSMTTASDLLI